MSPGAASVAETDLTIVGFTSSLFVTVLLATGFVWSESTVPVFEIVYGVSEIGSVVLVLTVNETVAVSPGASVPIVQVTVPAACAAGRAARAAHVDRCSPAPGR